jgi:hypothetical protein
MFPRETDAIFYVTGSWRPSIGMGLNWEVDKMINGNMRGARIVRLLPIAVALVILAAVINAAFQGETTLAKSARYASFDVSLTLREDGSYHVVETQRVRFDEGSFTSGYRTIPLDRIGKIEQVRVYELTARGRLPYFEVDLVDLATRTEVFSVLPGQHLVSIYWTFSPAENEERTFLIEYDVREALRVYPAETPPNEQIWWTAFGSELTNETPVDAASIQITLPEAVPVADVVVAQNDEVGNAADHTSDGKVFTWSRTGFRAGEDFTARLQFPIIVDVVAPSWQAQDDQDRAKAELNEKHDAEMTVVLLAAGLALATGGGIGAYGVWWARGRDPFVGVFADFLPTLPSDLPAAVAGTLLDERADEHDVVAIIFDLGNHGVLKVTDVGLLGPSKRTTRHNYILEVVNPNVPMSPAEREVLHAIFGSSAPKAGEKTSLKDAGPRILDRAPAIKDALYQELIVRGFFTRSPEQSRDGWRKVGIGLELGAIAFGIVGVLVLNWMALFPAAVILALGLVVIRMSRAMPRKTAAGAEEAAKWRAFRRYLEDLDKYEKVTESSTIIERYLSYAIAFECEKIWIGRYQDAGSFSFDWLEVFGWDDDGSYRPSPANWGSTVSVPNVDLPNVGMPDVQSLSTKSALGIQKGSDDLADVLNVVGAILEVVSAFSGGGGSGGSSGGGGGGFS